MKEETGRVFVYEQPKTGDLFTIPDPVLKMEELEQVQIEVAALLEHGLPVEGEEWPPVEVPAEEVAETTEATAEESESTPTETAEAAS